MKLPSPRPDWQHRPHPLAPKSQVPPRFRSRLKPILIAAPAWRRSCWSASSWRRCSGRPASVPAPADRGRSAAAAGDTQFHHHGAGLDHLSAIRDAAEHATPRSFAGKANNPVAQVLQNADIGWTASRGAIAATGAQDALSLAAPLSGKINVTGSLSAKVSGAVGDAIGSLLGADAAKQIGGINIKNMNANAEIKGNVVITMRPRFAANWHVEPNFSAQVNLGDSTMTVAGARLNVPAQIKPVIDKTVNEQMNAIGEQLRNDPTLMRNAQAQWSARLPFGAAAGAQACLRSGSRSSRSARSRRSRPSMPMP